MHLPSNEVYENLLLGSCLNSFEAANDCLSCIGQNDFMSEQNKSIVEPLKRFFKETGSLDLSMFIQYLKKTDCLEKCGGVKRLVEISDSVGISFDHNHYLEEIQNLTALRKMILMADDVQKLSMKKDAKFQDILKVYVNQLTSIETQSKTITYTPEQLMQHFSEHGTFRSHTEWMQDQIKQGRAPYTGIASNYPILDETLGFFREGAIYYIGARTSMGKTTFMLNLIVSMLSREDLFPIGVFSLEMNAKIIMSKIVCMMADVSYSDYEDGQLSKEKSTSLFDMAEKVMKMPLLIEDDEDMSLSKIRSRARRLVKKHGAKIIFIDYLTRIKSDTKYSSKHLQVDEISKGLQSMAKELNVPVICLAQLNRASENAQGSMPTLSSFRESGSIEEDCDGAILLHRQDYYDKDVAKGILTVIVAKNRIRGQLRNIQFKKFSLSERFEELPPMQGKL